MLKYFKYIFLFLILIIGALVPVVFYYLENDVELMVAHYPHVDAESGEIRLKQVKPKGWVELEEISSFAKWAIILSEDWAFYDHKGIDFNQLSIVIEESLRDFELKRGASTITQQVIKNLFLSHEKSLNRKFKEMILAYKAETVVAKDRLLTIYLNIIELGPNIYGIENASRFYFQKRAKNLTVRESAFLAMLLPSPVKYSYSFRQRKLSDFAKEQIDKIMFKMKQAKVITIDMLEHERFERFAWEVTPESVESGEEDI
jgi:monofunctional biosynthetic peptidoglycan transglycosylase